eukprot:TRINITY_DN18271_c0_g1_i1.p1 TRINITY_DN18271_c0_g1~~TRINITY_DN18271_c0_g1_i1.p1  ORF type:complete len:1019 (-),score=240.56 TRINITY_DN18271_c0_g1_i1:28-3000(-)
MSQKFSNGAKNLPPRHQHSDEPPPSKKEATPAKASKSALEKEVNVAPVPNTTRYRFSRRPFLHILVLFASDTRVLNYAKEVQQIFLDNGIDVLLQYKAPDDQWIKTDNLSNIINDSIGDHLIVLGDRNMKNHSCSCRNKGKLSEVKIEDVIATMWSEWGSKVVDDGQFPIKDMRKGTIEQVYQLLEHSCSIRRLKERMDQLKKDVDEFKHFARSLGHLANESLQPSAEREKIASQITATQKGLISLHQRLIKAVELLQQLPLHNQKLPSNSGRGMAVDADYRPTELKAGVPASLRDQTLQEVQRLIPKVEKFGADLTEAGAPLWLAYWTDYLKNARPASAAVESSSSSAKSSSKSQAAAAAAAAAVAAEQATSAKASSSLASGVSAATKAPWSCHVCTFDNAATAAVCEMCQTARAAPSAVDWEMTGTAGRRQRKEKREEEERLLAERQEEERRRADQRARQLEEEKKQRERKKEAQQKAAAAQPQKAAPTSVPLATPAHVAVPIAAPAPVAPFQPTVKPSAQLPQQAQQAPSPSRSAQAVHPSPLQPAAAGAAGWKAQQPQQAKSTYQPPPPPQHVKAAPVASPSSNAIQNAEYNKNYPSLSGQMAELDIDEPQPAADSHAAAGPAPSPSSSQSSLSPSASQPSPLPAPSLPPGPALAAPVAQPVARQSHQPQLLSQLPPFLQQAAQAAAFVPASQQASYAQQQQQLQQLQQQQHASVFAQHGPQSVFSQGSQSMFGQQQPYGYGQTPAAAANVKYAPMLTPQQQTQYDQQQQQAYMSQQAAPSHQLSGLWQSDGQQQPSQQQQAAPSSASAASVTSAPGSSQFSPFAYMSQPQVYNNWAAAFTPMSTYAPASYVPQQQVYQSHVQQSHAYGGYMQPYTMPMAPDESAAASTLTPEERERETVRSLIVQKLNGFKPQRPCDYCGDESQLECNLCAKIGYVATYFCSPEHQSLRWREHLEYHKKLHESIYGPGSGTSTNSMLSSSSSDAK